MIHRSLILILILIVGCGPQPRNPTAEVQSNAAVSPSTTAIPSSIELRILAWNIESDGADPNVIAAELNAMSGYQLYAFSEVDDLNFELFRCSVGEQFKSIEGSNVYNDHLQILYDANRLSLIRTNELNRYAEFEFNNRRHRSPLFAHFKDNTTGREFQLVTNHLARGDAKLREQQANGLREWGRDQTLPTIAIGDFNFDFDFHTKTGNDAFRAFIRDGVWKWAEPAEWIDTNWADRNKDGEDDFPDSMLDFAFVAGPAKDWESSCRVVVREGDFPDDEKTSDHRPIELMVEVN